MVALMNPLRLLLLCLLGWLLGRALKRARRATARPRVERFEPMARCSGCGVFFPDTALDGSGRCRHCVPS